MHNNTICSVGKFIASVPCFIGGLCLLLVKRSWLRGKKGREIPKLLVGDLTLHLALVFFIFGGVFLA